MQNGFTPLHIATAELQIHFWVLAARLQCQNRRHISRLKPRKLGALLKLR